MGVSSRSLGAESAGQVSLRGRARVTVNCGFLGAQELRDRLSPWLRGQGGECISSRLAVCRGPKWPKAELWGSELVFTSKALAVEQPGESLKERGES